MTATAPFMPPGTVRGPGPGPQGPQSVVPPSSVPLTFFVAAGVGMVAFGLATWFAADRIATTPTHPGVVSAVHLGVLAFLSMTVLGALHQFAPVVGQRRLRSTAAAWVTFVAILATAWAIPTGFAHGPSWLIRAGGIAGLVAVLVLAWNLSRPLADRDGGLPLVGIRLSVTFLVITVAFGVVYAFDRQEGWFVLLPHRVLAHAHLGLLGWLGLTYVSVAEKLWPMFLLAHRPSTRPGTAAVTLIASGVPILATGLLFAVPAVAWLGGVVTAAGLVAHLVSLFSCVRHRRRRIELLHIFLFTSAAFLVAAMVFGLLAGALDVSPVMRGRLVAAEVAALIGWLGLAIVGHIHKIVPFIGYTALRARGIRTTGDGRPLLFSHLFAAVPARISLVVGTIGFALLVAGTAAAVSGLIATGGCAIALTAVIVVSNLATGPRRATRGVTAASRDDSTRRTP
ncbi:MAG: hypothetical protein IT198_08910 [Acidimicrobiia bacterium]|nr:hypothetical protein [Acidimicrobiia bacterium]